ncbi:type VII secretion system-associated protein [Micromonospora sp. 15K316]|uniref:type VII secretion system-associated protein n=1 Tax=Micromonospora sp. 15K316 TaxID=2530376 RepID=UPI00104AACEB|nr:type VII secretion system-associated protein [Micromonospora sp. 15K316]TDC28499.1 type VII secretion system-associated protein [Micromonospora sp. 15K316]
MSEQDDTGYDRNWMLLLDSDWSPPPEADRAVPPVETIVGGWLVEDDGTVGPFEPNPLYLPSGEDAPTGPVDAAAKLVVAGRAEPSLVLLAMRDSLIEVAIDDDDRVIVAPAPDGAPCVLIATGAADQVRVRAPGWRQVSSTELVELLPEGVDVLLNPGGAASMRLFAGALREAVTGTE